MFSGSVNAEAVLKGTNFNGIYECHSGSNSVTVDHTCYREVVSRGITSVDVMALTYCEENGIPGWSHSFPTCTNVKPSFILRINVLCL